jgi:hypothetical protein
MYRYVCPKCLETELNETYDEEMICWKCEQVLLVIPKLVIPKRIEEYYEKKLLKDERSKEPSSR